MRRDEYFSGARASPRDLSNITRKNAAAVSQSLCNVCKLRFCFDSVSSAARLEEEIVGRFEVIQQYRVSLRFHADLRHQFERYRYVNLGPTILRYIDWIKTFIAWV